MTHTLTIGDRVQDILGHWYQIVRIDGPYSPILVQPLTPVGTTLYPLGGPVLARRSELRLQ